MLLVLGVVSIGKKLDGKEVSVMPIVLLGLGEGGTALCADWWLHGQERLACALKNFFGFGEIPVGASRTEKKFEVVGNGLKAAGDAKVMIGCLGFGMFGSGVVFFEHGSSVLDFMLVEFGGPSSD